MEMCPRCKKYTLSVDLRNTVARCFSTTCRFQEKIENMRDYFERFEISELNWPNYCAQTPVDFRVLGPSKNTISR